MKILLVDGENFRHTLLKTLQVGYSCDTSKIIREKEIKEVYYG